MKSEFFFCDSPLIHAHNDNHVMMVQLDNPLENRELIVRTAGRRHCNSRSPSSKDLLTQWLKIIKKMSHYSEDFCDNKMSMFYERSEQDFL